MFLTPQQETAAELIASTPTPNLRAIAEQIGVNPSTIHNWKHKIPEFNERIETIKALNDPETDLSEYELAKSKVKLAIARGDEWAVKFTITNDKIFAPPPKDPKLQYQYYTIPQLITELQSIVDKSTTLINKLKPLCKDQITDIINNPKII